MTRGLVTNYALQSNGLNLSPWAITGTTITETTGQTDPTGGTGATLWTESTDGGATSHFVFMNVDTSLRGKILIQSMYVKAGTRTQVLLYGTGQAQAYVVSFDLTALTYVGANGSMASQGITAGIEVCREDPNWRRVWMKYVAANNVALETRWYIGASNVFSYQGNGSAALTVYGAMVELAHTTQDTPSPYIASAAAAATGKRDYRQNLLLQSKSHTASPWANDGTATLTANYAPDQLGRNVATRVQMIATSTRYIYQNADLPLPDGTLTIAAWLRATTSTATVRLRLPTINARTSPVYSSDIVLDTTWRRYSFTLANVGAGSTGNFAVVGVFNGSAAAAADFLVGNVQVAKTNTLPDEVETTSSQFNPNGAPRALST